MKIELVKRLKNSYGEKGCFARGTLVSTPEGEIEIQDLEIGDSVLVYDDKLNYHEGKVTKTFHHGEMEVWEYTFWGGYTIQATTEHLVLNQFSAFVPIDSLGLSDFIFDHNNHLRSLISKRRVKDQETFNLEVEPWHTFVANKLKVHNGAISVDLRNLAGRKGGKSGGGSAAREAPNTLKSKAVAKALDLISEG